MSATNSVVAVYDSREDAERTVEALEQGGIDMKSLSIAGGAMRTNEHVIGYYNAGDRMKYWGKVGAFLGRFVELLFGSALFAIPGMDKFSLLVRWLAGLSQALKEQLYGSDGVSALGAGLVSIGIPNDSVITYETALKTDKFLIMVHGHRTRCMAHD